MRCCTPRFAHDVTISLGDTNFLILLGDALLTTDKDMQRFPQDIIAGIS
jgi:hypothetical protein